MKYKFNCVFIFFSVFFIEINAQNTTIKGTITDAETIESLIGANIFVPEEQIGTISNEYGFFSIQLPKDSLEISFSYIGYETKKIVFNLEKDTILNIKLKSSSLIDEVVISGETNSKSLPNVLKIPVKRLATIPVIGGEEDIFKSLSFYTGISIGEEGSSNLYVRGGTPDQNLILIDGVPVYNASHIGGYLSVFNTKAINNIQVLKGAFPARYGGRLSSVIDISLKEGNKNKFNYSYGIGLLTSNLLLEGPIKKQKSSYIFTARSSYLGLVNLFRDKDSVEEYINYWLYDINFKSNFDLKNGNLFFSVYTGNDYGIGFSKSSSSISGSSGTTIINLSKDESIVNWGNTIVSSRYTLAIGDKLFAKFLLGYSEYRYKNTNRYKFQDFNAIDTLVEQSAQRNQSNIRDIIANVNFDYSLSSKQFIKFGGGLTKHNFSISSANGISVSELSAVRQEEVFNSTELFAYLEDEINLFKTLNLNIGIRVNNLHTQNQNFTAFEPRTNIAYNFKKFNISGSYSFMQQYLHLLSANGFGFPNDIWVPSTNKISPSQSEQFTLGADFKLGSFDFSTVAYFKKMKNLIDYKAGTDDASFQINNWENLVETNGKGESKGIEFSVQKNIGKLKGSINYTLSKTDRQFDNISFGEKYPFSYDRRHDFSILGNYQISEKWKLSSSWVFQTGNAVSLPAGTIINPSNQSVEVYFTARNNGRLPNYHRLDIGAECKKITKKQHEIIWKLSVYNCYNRKNANYLQILGKPVFDSNNQFLYNELNVNQVSLFGFLPAFSFNYKL